MSIQKPANSAPLDPPPRSVIVSSSRVGSPKEGHVRRTLIAVSIVACLALSAALFGPLRRLFHPLVVRVSGTHTVAQRLDEFAAARARVRECCDRAGVQFPPSRVVFLALKDARRLAVYAGPDGDSLRRACTYPILAASGSLGPKLRDGDRHAPA